MATRTVEVVVHSDAPILVVWDLLADFGGWSKWSLYEETRLEAEGVPAPSGVGARRFVKADRMRNTEEVFAFEPPHRLAYVVLQGNLPARQFRSDVQLAETESGATEIWWRMSYRAKFFGTGWLLDRNLRILLNDTARRLSIRAETGRPAPEDL